MKTLITTPAVLLGGGCCPYPRPELVPIAVVLVLVAVVIVYYKLQDHYYNQSM